MGAVRPAAAVPSSTLSADGGGVIVGPDGSRRYVSNFVAEEKKEMKKCFNQNAQLPYVESTKESRAALCMRTTEAQEAAAKYAPSPADEALVAEKLNQPNVLVVFAKSTCAFCSHAKQLLNSLSPRPVLDIVDLDGQPRHGPVQQALRRHTGTSSVPQVLLNGKWVGNGQELDWQHQQGLLVPKLQQLGCSFK
eukprot:gnl/TRDRNA2_/TRDRNA2_81196_c0_seq1.p1 gnl/TRDRNA2_/TRDRNA2_81196_c0~~gnl/TRDRNA2_/TRDRNA2_81196_c0_seq1.p1  ORF type:complete len:209 (+),score=36.34 gnl/TRDRNA2_/TRDRNA2_81196_c0_seq1:51-629(+)